MYLISGLLSFKKPETVLWTIENNYYYRGSPLSTNSLSTIPEVVRFINSTKSVNSPK